MKSTNSELAKWERTNILLIVNNGDSALGMEKFKALVSKYVRNNTDYVITCGVYYYSDGFDSFVITPFEIDGIHNCSGQI